MCIPRDDPVLHKVFEQLGHMGMSLEIIEIPDDVEWFIDDYKGREWVAEKHRTWGKHYIPIIKTHLKGNSK